MSRTLILFMFFLSLANAFYVGNYYLGNLPYRFFGPLDERRLGHGQWRGVRDFPLKDDEFQKNKKDATLPMKRFKPCYYSPIQCLIKRK